MLGSSFRFAALRASLRIAGDLLRTWIRPPASVVGAESPATVTLRRGAVATGQLRFPLRVVTWNIHRAYDLEGVASGVQRLLRGLDADLMLLQEVPVWPDGPWWEHRSVRDVLAEYDIGFAPMHRVHRPGGYYPFHAAGQAVVSRWALDDVEAMRLAPVSRPKLGRNHQIRRVVLMASVEDRRGPIRVVNVHLENTARPAGRTVQAAEVVRALDRRRHLPTVLGGDFNDLLGPWEGVDAVLRGAGFTAHSRSGRWRRRRIDRVYGRGLEIVQSGRLDVSGSDHRPVFAEFRGAPR